MSIAAAIVRVREAERSLSLSRDAAAVLGPHRALLESEIATIAAIRDRLLLMDDTGAGFGDDRLPLRFWNKVALTSGGCWVWAGAVNDKGYGQFREGDRIRRAHVVSYETLVGAVPADLQLDHVCSRQTCVRPSHLEPVTHLVNQQRAAALRDRLRLVA